MHFNVLSWKSALCEYWNNLQIWVREGKQKTLYPFFKTQSDSLLAFSSKDSAGVWLQHSYPVVLLKYDSIIY